MTASQPADDEVIIASLNRREREILALLAQDQSAAEMAQRLQLAVSSVKWNQQQLYGKLGVHSKKQAVARAQALGLLAGAAPAVNPPAPKHNLPNQITRFFGRETETAQVLARLAEQRLVMLSGPGGVGKTRLALWVAEAVVGNYAEGVWLIELAPLADPALVVQSVALAVLATLFIRGHGR